MKTKRLRLFFVGVWEPILLGLVSAVVLIGLMLFRLGNLVPQLSLPEISTFNSSHSLRAIINNPLNLPFKLLSFVLNNIIHPNSFSLRFISVVFATITVLLFYYVTSRWYSRLVAILGALLFICSAWLLHYARLAVPDITITLLLAALAYGLWIRKTKHSALVGVIGIGLATSLIYLPGLIWFVIIAAIWQSKQIGVHLKSTKLTIPLIIILAAVLLAPLAIAIAQRPVLIKPLLGLPSGHLPTVFGYIKHTLEVPVQIFLRGPANPVIWLGRLPLLDIFTATMCLLGFYTYYKHRQLDSVKLIFGILIIGTLLVGLNGSVSIIILAPFVYLLAAGGINYLLSQWLKVFPRNPLARTIGTGLIIFTILLACFYNLRQYFIAWPGAPITKYTFRHKI